MSPRKVGPSPLAHELCTYGVTRNGFLPEEDPLSRLSHEYYKPWEDVMARLPMLVKMSELRPRVDQLPVLMIVHLEAEKEWQRAYSILAFMAQGYIWSGDQPSQRLPPALTVPFLQVSSHFGLPPVASYAALNLWNWRRLVVDADITQPQNLEAIHTVTGTEDESWFFVISTALEARAGRLIGTMIDGLSAVRYDDFLRLVDALSCLRWGLDEISDLLQRMDERCNPQVFYHKIRPLLAGSLNMGDAGLPNGVFYDEGDGKGSWRKIRGGSNGQSSLLQLFDAILGVKHLDKEAFHQEMRKFMPKPHAELIADMESTANIRQYVEDHETNVELVTAYDSAVASLSNFRNQHIRIATRYVILPSRMARQGPMSVQQNLAAPSAQPFSSQGLVGTGGTMLVPFLRQMRDETMAAAVNGRGVTTLPHA